MQGRKIKCKYYQIVDLELVNDAIATYMYNQPMDRVAKYPELTSVMISNSNRAHAWTDNNTSCITNYSEYRREHSAILHHCL